MHRTNLIASIAAALFAATAGYSVPGQFLGVAAAGMLLVIVSAISERLSRLLTDDVVDNQTSLFYGIFILFAGFVAATVANGFIREASVDGWIISIVVVPFSLCSGIALGIVVTDVARSYRVSTLRALFAAVPILGVFVGLNRRAAV